MLTIADVERYAAAHLPKQVYDYYASGADAMTTLRENTAAYGRCGAAAAPSADMPLFPALWL